MTRDRDLTEKKILDAVGRIVERLGFEAVGVNAVAAESGVSKVLIYRYFGSIDDLLSKYLESNDFWLNYDFNNLPIETLQPLDKDQLKQFSQQLFRTFITKLRNSPALRKLYRWELSSSHPALQSLRQRREETAQKIIGMVSRFAQIPLDDVAVFSTMITATMSYLCILADNCPIYNTLKIDSEEGWEKIMNSIDSIFEILFDHKRF